MSALQPRRLHAGRPCTLDVLLERIPDEKHGVRPDTQVGGCTYEHGRVRFAPASVTRDEDRGGAVLQSQEAERVALPGLPVRDDPIRQADLVQGV